MVQNRLVYKTQNTENKIITEISYIHYVLVIKGFFLNCVKLSFLFYSHSYFKNCIFVLFFLITFLMMEVIDTDGGNGFTISKQSFLFYSQG